MSPRLRILRGTRAGDEVSLSGVRMLIGRDPSADLRLDPDTDLAASKQHAELRREAGGWSVRDLGSRNGTFVNGVRAEGPVRLEPGDVIRFGGQGPEARFEMEASVTARVRARTAVATRRLRWIVGVLLALTAGAAVALLLSHGDRLSWERERDQLRATVDSLLQQEDRSAADLEGEVEALVAALEQSQDEVGAIRDELARREEAGVGSSDDVAALRRELEEATQALARQQMAATLDFRGIEDANRPAVVLVFVEGADGQVVSGTGFSVRDDALLVTARHLLEGPGGQVDPGRIAVQFSDSEQVWPARLLATSDTEDLALLQAENIRGAVPTVQGLNARPDTVQSGSPVASLGFPLGGGSTPAEAMTGRRPAVRPLLGAGVVRDVTRSHIEIQGFGEPGASGSPVLDARGEVIAVVSEGRRGPRGGVLVAIPANRVRALLTAAGAGEGLR
ncbi:MAG: FHA domain-containing protein [Gemmatimonadota bacterium]